MMSGHPAEAERALGTDMSPSPVTLMECPQLRLASVAQPHKIPFPIATCGEGGADCEVKALL